MRLRRRRDHPTPPLAPIGKVLIKVMRRGAWMNYELTESGEEFTLDMEVPWAAEKVSMIRVRAE